MRVQISPEEKSQLVECFDCLALELDFEPLPDEISSQLAEHLLGKAEFRGVEGKEMAAALECGLVTQEECAKFLAGHAATKLQNHYGIARESYSISGPLSKAFCSFARSLANQHA